MATRKASLVGAVWVLAFPGVAWAAGDSVPGAPLIAALAAAAGLSVAVAAGILIRRHAGEAAESAALRRDLGRREALLATATDAFYAWYPDAGESCSPRLAEWLGVSPETIDGFARLGPYFKPDHFAALEAAAARLRNDGAPFTLDLETADGHRTLAATGGVARGAGGEAAAHVVWLRDVSAARGEAARLAATAAEAGAERDLLEAVLDAAPFPVWRRGDDFALAWCNEAYARAVETDLERAGRAPAAELIAADAPERASALARRAGETGTTQSETRHVVVDGDRRALEIVETPLAEGRGIAGFARDVTDVESAEAELQRYIEAHAEVLESLATPITIFGPDKHLKFFNSAYAKLSELDEDWLASEPSHGEILEALRERRRLPEQADFPAYKKESLDLYTSLMESREEILYLPDGTTIRTRISPHPFGGLLYLHEDVTDRLELERARHTLIEVQKATLNNLHEGVAVFGADGRLKLFNSSYARIWQLDEDMLTGEPHVSEVVAAARPLFDTGEDWESREAKIVARATDRTPRFQRLERPDGSMIDFASVPLPDGNMLNTYLDITDSVRIERALRERNEALETADRLKSEFIANVSYELRTPLNTVIGFSEILSNQYFGALTERQKEYSDGILESSHHLLDLINDILDLATIEAGRMVLEVESFDLHAMLTSVLALTREQARKQDLTLDFDCPPDAGLIEGDERRLKQVVFNMMSNAMKFTASGGTVTLGGLRDDERVELWVADTGIGIPHDEQHRVFGKFHKGAGPAERKPGAGLGLSLVKSFVDLHGGRVEIESTPGQGTRVTCHLPAKARPATAAAAVAAGGD